MASLSFSKLNINEMTSRTLPKAKPKVLSPWQLMEQMKKGALQLDAPYQRDIVWDKQKMTELIDSIFNNYYIPPLVFAVRKIRGKQTRIVIDGKQRLTSIKLFMENKIPFIDHVHGREIEVYYSAEEENDHGDQVNNYLTEAQMNVFNSFGFVCMEYAGINEDDEFEIFSRVQLGVAITTAEKLKSKNTPVASLCRQLATKYSDIKIFLSNGKRTAQIFQCIAHILLVIKDGRDTFKATPKNLQEFVCDPNYDPPNQLVKTLKKTLEVLVGIANDEDCYKIASHRGGKKVALRGLEVLCFAMYVASVQRPRSLKLYAQDFASLREYLYEQRDGKLYTSKDSYLTGMQHVEDMLSRYDLVSARPQVYQATDDSEQDSDNSSDELKLDEYEHEEIVFTQPPPTTKRRRPVEPTNGTPTRVLSVAKRGRGTRR